MDPEVQLVPADQISFGQRAAIMNSAYAGYYVPIYVNAEQMALMDEFYDIVPAHSVVARTRYEPVGQALLALRGRQAWISGVGVVPAWRRRGIARAMMVYLLAEAARAGAEEAVLEVIDRNTAAHRLYLSLGMVDRRELLTWQRPAEAGPLPVPGEPLRPGTPGEVLDFHREWHEEPVSWQRAEPTLRHMTDRLAGYRLDIDGRPAAYCLVAGGDDSIAIMDLGINRAAGMLIPGRLLLQALSARYVGRALSIMNVAADDSLCRLLADLDFRVTLRQREMAVRLCPT